MLTASKSCNNSSHVDAPNVGCERVQGPGNQKGNRRNDADILPSESVHQRADA